MFSLRHRTLTRSEEGIRIFEGQPPGKRRASVYRRARNGRGKEPCQTSELINGSSFSGDPPSGRSNPLLYAFLTEVSSTAFPPRLNDEITAQQRRNTLSLRGGVYGSSSSRSRPPTPVLVRLPRPCFRRFFPRGRSQPLKHRALLRQRIQERTIAAATSMTPR